MSEKENETSKRKDKSEITSVKRKINPLRWVKIIFLLLLIGVMFSWGYRFLYNFFGEKAVLKAIIQRLQDDSRIAEVLVVKAEPDPETKKNKTTIKFLEYDSRGQALSPKYFTFSDNLIQFQSLVVRFDDKFIATGDPLKGKSICLFWKAFVLDGTQTEEEIITPIYSIPEGYRIEKKSNPFEEEIWRKFWDVALNEDEAHRKGIKNAQIEAPGTKFNPGFLYTLTIEHDGGLRIDAKKLPEILRGEQVL